MRCHEPKICLRLSKATGHPAACGTDVILLRDPTPLFRHWKWVGLDLCALKVLEILSASLSKQSECQLHIS